MIDAYMQRCWRAARKAIDIAAARTSPTPMAAIEVGYSRDRSTAIVPVRVVRR